MSVCRFCTPDPALVLKSGLLMNVILSSPRLMPGHVLVVPKRHVERLSDLSSEELDELVSELLRLEQHIVNHVAKGCDIRQHYRPFQAENSLRVNHLHVHVQPRELFDELFEKCQTFETGIFQPLSDEERERMRSIFLKL